jgi:hypothetical protein
LLARIRTIKPEFFKNEELATLSPFTRLLFVGLWTQADREGRLEYRPRRLKAELFPYDDGLDIEEMLAELVAKGFLVRYEVEEVWYLAVLTFGKHQHCHIKESASTIPAPCKNGASTSGREGKDKGKEGEPPKPPKGDGFDPLKLPLPAALAFPEFAPVWAEWCKFRSKTKRNPVSETSGIKQLAFLAEQPTPLNVIEQSIRNGWTGLFPVGKGPTTTEPKSLAQRYEELK